MTQRIRWPVTNHMISLTQELGLRCKDSRMHVWPLLGQEPGLLSELFLPERLLLGSIFAWDLFPPLRTPCLLVPSYEVSDNKSQVF